MPVSGKGVNHCAHSKHQTTVQSTLNDMPRVETYARDKSNVYLCPAVDVNTLVTFTGVLDTLKDVKVSSMPMLL